MHMSQSILRSFFALIVVCGSVIGLAGCNDKEKVLDIETPNGGIEIERSRSTGEVEIEVDRDRR